MEGEKKYNEEAKYNFAREDLLRRVVGNEQAKCYQPSPAKLDLGNLTHGELSKFKSEANNLDQRVNQDLKQKQQLSPNPFMFQEGIDPDQKSNFIQGQFCYMNLSTKEGPKSIPGVFIPLQYIMPVVPAPPTSDAGKVPQSMPQTPQKAQEMPPPPPKNPQVCIDLTGDDSEDLSEKENSNFELKNYAFKPIFQITKSFSQSKQLYNTESLENKEERPIEEKTQNKKFKFRIGNSRTKENMEESVRNTEFDKNPDLGLNKTIGDNSGTNLRKNVGFQPYKAPSKMDSSPNTSCFVGKDEPCDEDSNEEFVNSNFQAKDSENIKDIPIDLNKSVDEEFAVHLKSGDSEEDPELYRNILELSMDSKQPTNSKEESKTKDDLLGDYILKLIESRRETQNLIDSGNFIKRGPGRHRKTKFPTTEKVKEMVDDFFMFGFEKLNQNKYNNTRTDACLTMYQRNLKKITLFLLKNVSVRNKYKCNDAKQFLMAYSETFVLFCFIFFKEIPIEDTLIKFLEFTCIYYPTVKVKSLAKRLCIEGSITKEFQAQLERLASIREQTSKKSFLIFVKNNSCMRRIIRYCKDLYDTRGKHVLKGRAAGCVQKLLYHFD
ncbi:unnamed protein product [Moneuplotes crassus]|uniref:Uncharacterized protein n=1 Tax=Euplotes crassus TaxID=5936 RepID=A0AAD2DB60_EUPCR|nr:unnamed protein product [Moneuplotes crassus]